MSTCDHICRECGGVINCQHCKPYQLPIDRHRIAGLEAALDEIYSASFRVDHMRDTIIVPIGAWDNAMRAIKPKQER